MNVGICKIKLHIPENQSLKGKRQIVKPIIAQVRNKFSVSIAEVDDNDLWQMSTLGISYVSNDRRHTNEVLSKVIAFVSNGRFDVEVVDSEIEILSI